MIALSRGTSPPGCSIDLESLRRPALRGDARRASPPRAVRRPRWSACSKLRPDRKPLSSRGGAVVRSETGAPVCAVDGGESRAIRTAAASAVATDALARRDARRVAILGTGEQAKAHATPCARFGRSNRSNCGAARTSAPPPRWRALSKASCSCRSSLATAEEGGGDADIVCTVTASGEPVCGGGWLSPGAHVKTWWGRATRSGEVDNDLVCGRGSSWTAGRGSSSRAPSSSRPRRRV